MNSVIGWTDARTDTRYRWDVLPCAIHVCEAFQTLQPWAQLGSGIWTCNLISPDHSGRQTHTKHKPYHVHISVQNVPEGHCPVLTNAALCFCSGPLEISIWDMFPHPSWPYVQNKLPPPLPLLFPSGGSTYRQTCCIGGTVEIHLFGRG